MGDGPGGALVEGESGPAVLAGNPDIDRLQTCRFPGYDRSQPQQGVRAYMQLRREAARLQAEEYQLALNLRTDFWWGAALAAFAGIPYVWGFDSPECAPFLTHAQPAQNDEHQAASNLRLVQAAAVIGAEVEDVPTHLHVGFTRQDEESADTILRTVAMPDHARLIAIHPGSGAPIKNWSPAGWHAVGNDLAADDRTYYLVTSGPTEQELARKVVTGLPQDRAFMAGEISIGVLAALYARCALVMGPDSGPLHLAVAVGTPSA